jgi:hypothetical protein
MRPAFEAGLMVLLEVADPYMRPVPRRKQGIVLPVEIHLSKFWSRAFPIGKGSASLRMRKSL